MKKLKILTLASFISISAFASSDSTKHQQPMVIYLDESGQRMFIDIIKNTSASYNEVQYFVDMLNKQQQQIAEYQKQQVLDTTKTKYKK